MSNTFNAWYNMFHRCNNPSNLAYEKDAKICARWSDYTHFREDIGYLPEGFMIERIDKDGMYEPCNWHMVTPDDGYKWFCAYGPNGETIIEHDPKCMAAFCLNSQCISDCLCGKIKHHKGWRFQRITKNTT